MIPKDPESESRHVAQVCRTQETMSCVPCTTVFTLTLWLPCRPSVIPAHMTRLIAIARRARVKTTPTLGPEVSNLWKSALTAPCVPASGVSVLQMVPLVPVWPRLRMVPVLVLVQASCPDELPKFKLQPAQQRWRKRFQRATKAESSSAGTCWECNELVSWCCVRCSTPNRVLPLHPPLTQGSNR